MDQEAMERLEIKIAYLEKASGELSDVIFRQQLKIEQLDAQVKSLHARLAALVTEDLIHTLEDERPPHY
jgi:uncharacterized coiled-coil protein SlyX